MRKEYLNLVLSELNIKEAEFTKSKKVSLDTQITQELEAEGEARDLIREIQEKRKEAKVAFDSLVTVYAPDWPKKYEDLIKRETLAKELVRAKIIKIQKS